MNVRFFLSYDIKNILYIHIFVGKTLGICHLRDVKSVIP